jgi:hypothetical protein
MAAYLVHRHDLMSISGLTEDLDENGEVVVDGGRDDGTELYGVSDASLGRPARTDCAVKICELAFRCLASRQRRPRR